MCEQWLLVGGLRSVLVLVLVLVEELAEEQALGGRLPWRHEYLHIPVLKHELVGTATGALPPGSFVSESFAMRTFVD